VVGVSVTHAPRHLRMLRSAWHELNMNLITATWPGVTLLHY
jgi:hypothetical protein